MSIDVPPPRIRCPNDSSRPDPRRIPCQMTHMINGRSRHFIGFPDDVGDTPFAEAVDFEDNERAENEVAGGALG